MLELIEPPASPRLHDYEAFAHLSLAVRDLREEGLLPRLADPPGDRSALGREPRAPAAQDPGRALQRRPGARARAGADAALEHPARRLSRDGEWLPATQEDELDLMFRPIVTQISRWDRLKGFAPLLQAFLRLKRRTGVADPLHRRRLELVRLVLAGPETAAVADDPEGREVLAELTESYRQLPEEIQRDVALISLPMASRRENALMVNALQRCSTVVGQNSIEEGFGLTVSEAMWKRKPVLGSHACGIRQQIHDGIDGCLVDRPEDPEVVEETLEALPADGAERERLGAAAQRRVYQDFLVFAQIRNWLRLLVELADPA